MSDWGAKHTCHSCSARFYDLNHTPVTCPRCETVIGSDASKPAKKEADIHKVDELNFDETNSMSGLEGEEAGLEEDLGDIEPMLPQD